MKPLLPLPALALAAQLWPAAALAGPPLASIEDGLRGGARPSFAATRCAALMVATASEGTERKYGAEGIEKLLKASTKYAELAARLAAMETKTDLAAARKGVLARVPPMIDAYMATMEAGAAPGGDAGAPVVDSDAALCRQIAGVSR